MYAPPTPTSSPAYSARRRKIAPCRPHHLGTHAYHCRRQAYSAPGSALERFSASKRSQLHEALQGVHSRYMPANMRPAEIETELERWFESCTVDLMQLIKQMLIKRSTPSESLLSELEQALLSEQWKDARMRLYGAALTPDQKNIRAHTRMEGSLLIPVYRSFGRTFSDLLSSAAHDVAAEALVGRRTHDAASSRTFQLQKQLLDLPLAVGGPRLL